MLVKNWLERECNEWFMVIDNADEASLFESDGGIQNKSGPESIVKYLPECSHGSILVTTRNRAAGVKFTRSRAADLVEVKTMNEMESKCLIKSNLTEHIPADFEIYELAELLDHLPLALAQASAFMQENVLSVSEYIELYRENDETRMDLLCEPFEALGRDTKVPNAVATTLNVSIGQIEDRDPRAIEIFSLIAFLDRHDIPRSLVQHKVKRLLDLTKSLGTLKAFSLINTNDERGSFSIHRLVQLVMRKWMIIRAKFDDKAVEALDVLVELFPDATFENRAICASYLPHAQSVLRSIQKVDKKSLRRTLYLQEGIAWYLWTQGYYDEAERLDKQILDENKKAFGTEHPETLESIGNLASTYEDQGRWTEVEELDRFMVATRSRLHGPTHLLTLTSIANLANTYRHQGRLEEAESLMLEVMETRKSSSGKDSEEVISSMSNLGSLYLAQHRLEEAEELISQAWNFRKRTIGAEHVHALDNATTLGLIYSSQGRLDEAVMLTLYTLQTKEAVMGPTHPSSLSSKSDLACLKQKQQEWDEAEELLSQVIEAESHRLGPAHNDALISRKKLSNIYWDKGLVGMTDKLEGEILQDSNNSLGPDHRFTLECMYDMALTRKEQNKNEEAIQLLMQVTNLREKKLGAYHSDTLDSIGTLCEWCGDEKGISMLLDAEMEEEGKVGE
ncbi:hypothetical protein PHISP_02699 [Aspergillus sp. HF37]|nr:hypothetical protein PHISP_02699 [Aspergillus sp. HF37]